MGIVSPGFFGRRGSGDTKLPPGQYLTHDFPVLSAGPTPRIDLAGWQFTVTTETPSPRAAAWRAKVVRLMRANAGTSAVW